MDLKLLLILPVAVIVASGCLNLGGDTGVSGNGVVITSFDSSLSSIESQDEVVLHLEVQNRGDAIATAAARLINIHSASWGEYITDQPIGNLLPADEDAGTEGQTGEVYWSLLAPDLVRGEKQTYEPMARMYYTYETRAIKPIMFLTSEETKRAVQNGESLPSDAAIVSAGPLSVTVRAGEFVRTKDDYRQSWFPITINIQNTGGGLLAGYNYPIGIDIEAPAGTHWKSECPGWSQSMGMSVYEDIPGGLFLPSSTSIINMYDGRETKVTCELIVDQPPVEREKRDMYITLRYIYYQDATIPITVTGTTEWGGFY